MHNPAVSTARQPDQARDFTDEEHVKSSCIVNIALQQPRLTHDDPGLRDAGRNTLVGQNRRAVDVELVFDGDIVTKHSDVLQSSLLLERDPSEHTHRPTLLFHPTIEFATQA